MTTPTRNGPVRSRPRISTQLPSTPQTRTASTGRAVLVAGAREAGVVVGHRQARDVADVVGVPLPGPEERHDERRPCCRRSSPGRRTRPELAARLESRRALPRWRPRRGCRRSGRALRASRRRRSPEPSSARSPGRPRGSSHSPSPIAAWCGSVALAATYRAIATAEDRSPASRVADAFLAKSVMTRRISARSRDGRGDPVGEAYGLGAPVARRRHRVPPGLRAPLRCWESARSGAGVGRVGAGACGGGGAGCGGRIEEEVARDERARAVGPRTGWVGALDGHRGAAARVVADPRRRRPRRRGSPPAGRRPRAGCRRSRRCRGSPVFGSDAT